MQTLGHAALHHDLQANGPRRLYVAASQVLVHTLRRQSSAILHMKYYQCVGKRTL